MGVTLANAPQVQYMPAKGSTFQVSILRSFFFVTDSEAK
jgi:hypothetical protein